MSIHDVYIMSVRYDEDRKAMLGRFFWNGQSMETVLKIAGQMDANNDVFTEDSLREAVKKWKPGTRTGVSDSDL